MNTFQHRLSDRLFLAGLAFISLALVFFCLPIFQHRNPMQDAMGLAMVVYIITVIYFVMLLGSGRLRKGNDGLAPLFLFLILFMISSFALNRELNVFESSVPWVTILLCAAAFIVTFMAVRDSLPPLLVLGLLFVLGAGFALLLYFSFYLLPMYIIAGIAFFVLGLSLHVFAPLLWVLFTLKLLKQVQQTFKKAYLVFGSGCLLALLIAVGFIWRWSQQTQELNKIYRSAGIEQAEGLPAWMEVARNLSSNDFSEKLLKADLVYTSYQGDDFFFNWSLPSRRFDEPLKHDPLIFLATVFAGKLSLTEEDRIKILKLGFNARHQAEERLWSGNHLVTESVSTHVDLWPDNGIAYTEKELVVTNSEQVRGNWKNKQEALYTFRLPEGAVVSSLSLWIDGKEQKARLTSRGKADSAYRQIVGVEQRDPSVVHWQEGNRVVLRVFPVLSGESRKVKIGITSSLIRKKEEMQYQQISFKGPDFSDAKESVQILLHQKTSDLKISHKPQIKSQRGMQGGWLMEWSDVYEEDWSLQFKPDSQVTGSFSFDGYRYRLKPLVAQSSRSLASPFAYLDVNASWTKEEFNKILQLLDGRPVYVYLNSLQELTPENKEQLFKALTARSFSLFPFHAIEHPESSILISKSNGEGPELEELKGSRFYDALLAADKMSSLLVWQLDNTSSPYMNTLQQYRYFNGYTGNMDELEDCIEKNLFPESREDENQVLLPNSGWMITREKDTVVQNTNAAPDHLMRLFYYNWILLEHGKALRGPVLSNEPLVEKAEKAHIVSPVSSLVVLETEQDYKRFGIDKNKNGLDNASKSSKGAVPEPHEWALLLVVGMFIFLTTRFSRFKTVRA